MRIVFLGDSLTAGIPGSSYLTILREELAADTLINLGKANDTVVSLYHRMAGLRFDEPFDIAFLWVGVNDLPTRTSRLYRAVNAVVLDALTLRSREQIDRQATKRGLHFTLDGLHLNSAGAEIVAEAFMRVIREYHLDM